MVSVNICLQYLLHSLHSYLKAVNLRPNFYFSLTYNISLEKKLTCVNNKTIEKFLILKTIQKILFVFMFVCTAYVNMLIKFKYVKAVDNCIKKLVHLTNKT